MLEKRSAIPFKIKVVPVHVRVTAVTGHLEICDGSGDAASAILGGRPLPSREATGLLRPSEGQQVQGAGQHKVSPGTGMHPWFLLLIIMYFQLLRRKSLLLEVAHLCQSRLFSSPATSFAAAFSGLWGLGSEL